MQLGNRLAALFRYNITLQKSQNHRKRRKEDQKGLLPDSKDPLSSSEEARPACDDNTATKPSLNSSKLTCEFEKSGQHCFSTGHIRNTLGFEVFSHGRSYIAFSTEDICFFNSNEERGSTLVMVVYFSLRIKQDIIGFQI